MRATTRGGGGTPLLIVLKWKEHDEEGVCAPLLVASKRKLEHDREGRRPPHRVEMARTRRRGAYPSSSRQKGNENTTGRAPGPPRRVQVARTRRGGECPSSSRQKENENTTGRAGTLPVMFKWQERNEEGYAPPRCVKKDRRTRRGGHQPSPSC